MTAEIEEMTATQVQEQLLEEIETLTPAQRQILLDFIRSFRSGMEYGANAWIAAEPLQLHFSQATPSGSFRREDLYGDDGR